MAIHEMTLKQYWTVFIGKQNNFLYNKSWKVNNAHHREKLKNMLKSVNW